jgi:hypothetical protein
MPPQRGVDLRSPLESVGLDVRNENVNVMVRVRLPLGDGLTQELRTLRVRRLHC